jgi:hypothetical protein
MKPWTVIVYMKVDFWVESYADAGLKGMERVGSSKDLNIVVHLDQAGGDGIERLAVNKGASLSLGRFRRSRTRTRANVALGRLLRWTEARFPARRYLLILSGHSYGLGFGRYPDDWLTIPELAKTLRRFRARRPVGRKLDLLGFSSCTMSHAEAALELHDAVRIMVAPQTGLPLQGWPYERVLADIRRNPTIRPDELSRRIVSHIAERYSRRNLSLAALDLRESPALAASLERLTAALMAAIRQPAERRSIARAFLRAASVRRVRPLVDLFDLCAKLSACVDDAAVRHAAKATLRMLVRQRRPLLLAHSSRGKRLHNLRGLGVYAPQVTTPRDWRSLRFTKAGYRALRLVRTTGWMNLVANLRSPEAGCAAG